MIEHKGKINPSVVAGLIFLHAGVLLAPFTFNWGAFWVCVALYWLTTVLGMTVCYHRLLTHKSFKCPKFFEYVLAFLGSLSSQGGPISWVATHRYHHVNSDSKDDCHSPRHGFLWSHLLWFVYRSSVLEDKNFPVRYAPELAKDPFYLFLERHGWIGQWVLGFLLFWWGGFPFLVWGIFVRTVAALHVTWLVNSASHQWGYRTFKTKDESKNLWWVGLLSFGEGWHNNHHAFQTSAAHGLRWWEVDVTYWTIRLFSFFGLVYDIRVPSRADRARLLMKHAVHH